MELVQIYKLAKAPVVCCEITSSGYKSVHVKENKGRRIHDEVQRTSKVTSGSPSVSLILYSLSELILPLIKERPKIIGELSESQAGAFGRSVLMPRCGQGPFSWRLISR